MYCTDENSQPINIICFQTPEGELAVYRGGWPMTCKIENYTSHVCPALVTEYHGEMFGVDIREDKTTDIIFVERNDCVVETYSSFVRSIFTKETKSVLLRRTWQC